MGPGELKEKQGRFMKDFPCSNDVMSAWDLHSQLHLKIYFCWSVSSHFDVMVLFYLILFSYTTELNENLMTSVKVNS